MNTNLVVSRYGQVSTWLVGSLVHPCVSGALSCIAFLFCQLEGLRLRSSGVAPDPEFMEGLTTTSSPVPGISLLLQHILMILLFNAPCLKGKMSFVDVSNT